MNAPWYSRIAVGILMSIVIGLDMIIGIFISIKEYWKEIW